MQEFTEQLRYEYPELDQKSIVLDCGGFEGNFAKIIYAKYGCKVFVFEPIFYRDIPPHADIRVFPIAVGGSARMEWFRIQNNSTGMFAGQGQPEQEVAVFPMSDIIRLFHAKIGLLKLNIEGMEFEALEDLVESGFQGVVRNIQVQFHNVTPLAERRRQVIQERLSITHELTYCADWCWENWKLK